MKFKRYVFAILFLIPAPLFSQEIAFSFGALGTKTKFQAFETFVESYNLANENTKYFKV